MLVEDFFHRSLEPVEAAEAFECFVQKGAQEHPSRYRLGDAPAAHVEQRCGVQLADGRSVRAAYVVGVDLQLGVGFHPGGGGEQDVVVLLVRLDLLGVGFDDDQSVENGFGRSADGVFESLVALSQGLFVVQADMVADARAERVPIDPAPPPPWPPQPADPYVTAFLPGAPFPPIPGDTCGAYAAAAMVSKSITPSAVLMALPPGLPGLSSVPPPAPPPPMAL